MLDVYTLLLFLPMAGVSQFKSNATTNKQTSNSCLSFTLCFTTHTFDVHKYWNKNRNFFSLTHSNAIEFLMDLYRK